MNRSRTGAPRVPERGERRMRRSAAAGCVGVCAVPSGGTAVVVSVENLAGPVRCLEVHRLQVAPHRGGRVGVTEYPLDVE